jgi:hypothetical protein
VIEIFCVCGRDFETAIGLENSFRQWKAAASRTHCYELCQEVSGAVRFFFFFLKGSSFFSFPALWDF